MNPLCKLCWILMLGGAALGSQNEGEAGPSSRRRAVAQPIGLTLGQVRESFSVADTNKSGSLDLAEAVASGLDGPTFALADADGDLWMSLAEFTVNSETRAARTGKAVAGDLRAESTRLQAQRRAERTQELLSRREAGAHRSTASGSGAKGRNLPVDGARSASSGPAASRGALLHLSDEERAWAALDLRSEILLRIRRGELTPENARLGLEAIDRRIAALTVEPAKAGAPNSNRSPRDSANSGDSGMGPSRPVQEIQVGGATVVTPENDRGAMESAPASRDVLPVSGPPAQKSAPATPQDVPPAAPPAPQRPTGGGIQ